MATVYGLPGLRQVVLMSTALGFVGILTFVPHSFLFPQLGMLNLIECSKPQKRNKYTGREKLPHCPPRPSFLRGVPSFLHLLDCCIAGSLLRSSSFTETSWVLPWGARGGPWLFLYSSSCSGSVSDLGGRIGISELGPWRGAPCSGTAV